MMDDRPEWQIYCGSDVIETPGKCPGYMANLGLFGPLLFNWCAFAICKVAIKPNLA